MQTATSSAQSRLKIGAVSRLTGLSVHVLRKWEERHRAVEPVRTGRGERLYNRDDVRRLALLKQLTDCGLGLSEIAHMPLEELEEVASDVVREPRSSAPSSAEQHVRVGIIGNALPALAGRTLGLSRAISIAGSGDDLDDLLTGHGPAPDIDVLVLELATLQLDTLGVVQQAITRCAASGCVVVYGFASEAALVRMRKPGIALLRAPANADGLLQAVLSVSPNRDNRGQRGVREMTPPPRLTRELIARIVSNAPAVKCECPKHIAELLFSLLAFDQYSEECVINHPEDAALHRYLADTTGRARSDFEEALVRLAQAEGVLIEA